jgi:hypothetical protein
MIAEHLKQFTDANPAIRTRAAEELGDILEYTDRSEKEVTHVGEALIDAAAREQNGGAREALMNSLAILASRHIAMKLPWDRLVPLLGSFDQSSLENALSAIGFSRDTAFLDVLNAYRNNPDPAIRNAATDALRELTFGAPVEKD